MECEALVNQLEQEQRNNSISNANEQLLSRMRSEAGVLRLKLNDKILSKRRHRRSKIRSATKTSSKQFWNLARRVVKKAGSLSAIKDLQGNLATDRETIINIVLEELCVLKLFTVGWTLSVRRETIMGTSNTGFGQTVRPQIVSSCC